MAAAVLALLVLAQAVPPSDAAVSTAPRMPTTRPAAAAAAMPSIANHSPPPSDDYGYVAWCYGALDDYLSFYDRVMPEVTRIERAFPSPRGADDDLKVYPEMRAQARKDLAGYRTAIVAAERVSPRPISEYGAASVRQGQDVWSATKQMTTVQIAREWMGWSPPAKCDVSAKALAAKSTGPALAASTGSALDAIDAAAPAPAAAEPAAPAPAKPPPAAPKPTPAPKVAAAKPAPAKPPAKAPASPALPIGAYVMDPNSDKGCPGRIDASVRGGKVAMVCLPIG